MRRGTGRIVIRVVCCEEWCEEGSGGQDERNGKW